MAEATGKEENIASIVNLIMPPTTLSTTNVDEFMRFSARIPDHIIQKSRLVAVDDVLATTLELKTDDPEEQRQSSP
ncbi:unnamed protein product [Clonostachys solani]|uniref:Uncharacterized protein n=1 Tax=Clonostachys solani TaxID=160281 RepID=A0A9N9ZL62_9HYPO|nr:unnamed protein product [Clonostachys solani]